MAVAAITVTLLTASAASAVTEWQDGELVLSGVPRPEESLESRVRQYFASREASFAGWLDKDWGILVRTRFGETTQLHWVSRPGGSRRQITFGRDPILNAWPVHGAERPQALFLRDRDGDEAFQLIHVDLTSGELFPLTRRPSRQGVVVAGHRAGLYAHYSTARNGRDWDLMRLQLPARLLSGVADIRAQLQPEQTMITQVDGTWMPLDWSMEDRWLLALQVESAAVSLPYLVKADGSQRIPLYPDGEKEAYMDAGFGRDGRAIYLLSNRGREFIGLFRLDLRSGEMTLVLDLPHDVEEMTLAPDRKSIAVVINQNGYSRLQLFRLSPWRQVKLPEIPAGIISDVRFSADSERIGFTLSSPAHPRDAYAVEIQRRRLTRWTHSEIGGLDEARMVVPTLIEYPSFVEPGGVQRQVPAWYYRTPRQGRKAEAPDAVVIMIHGGPEIQARPRFDAQIQYWTRELGLAVLVPNVRGSQGYGRTYVSLDNGFRRQHAVQDIGALLDWIAAQPELDARRVGLYGASYGGYMVLAAMADYGHRVRAGVDINGISDFTTFLRNTSEYRRNHRRAEYGDERDEAMRTFLDRISPLQMTGRIVSPLLIAQGRNDPRVPLNQSQAMVRSLRAAEREVWFLLAGDEGHGFRKLSNRLRLQMTVAQFWQQYLSL